MRYRVEWCGWNEEGLLTRRQRHGLDMLGALMSYNEAIEGGSEWAEVWDGSARIDRFTR